MKYVIEIKEAIDYGKTVMHRTISEELSKKIISLVEDSDTKFNKFMGELRKNVAEGKFVNGAET